MTAVDPGEVARIAGAVLDESPPEQQLAALRDYLDQLARWNVTYNLTGARDPQQLLVHHLADCLAVVPALRDHLAGRAGARVLDVGSGGGLPGVIVAIAAPEVDVTCIDAVAKKAAFVRHVAGALSLPNLHALHARVEQHRPVPPYDVITSRAFGTLADLTALTRQGLAPSGVWMAMKGRTPDDEIAALPADVEVFHVKPLHVPGLGAPRCLVWMRLRAAS
jgi:16S rRNA (guanine527-N7)-methyltransferase